MSVSCDRQNKNVFFNVNLTACCKRDENDYQASLFVMNVYDTHQVDDHCTIRERKRRKE